MNIQSRCISYSMSHLQFDIITHCKKILPSHYEHLTIQQTRVVKSFSGPCAYQYQTLKIRVSVFNNLLRSASGRIIIFHPLFTSIAILNWLNPENSLPLCPFQNTSFHESQWIPLSIPTATFCVFLSAQIPSHKT